MKYKAVLFDLDGTLLPMDQDIFTKTYFGELVKKLVPLGYEPDSVVSAIWAGLKPEDFELFTTYENSRYCKPNPEYYKEILKEIKLSPEDVLMVGNDVSKDMIAKSLGMDVFLLKDCLINKENADISAYPNGGFKELKEFLFA